MLIISLFPSLDLTPPRQPSYSHPMAKPKQRIVLFLCTGNYYRSRFSETLFNSIATKFGLAWKASSRGLALERGANNVGPMALTSIGRLKELGVTTSPDFSRFPQTVTGEELDGAEVVIALKETEHLPLMQERFAAWATKPEYWEVDDEPGVFPQMEREVLYLVSRLLAGGKPRDPHSPELKIAKAEPSTAAKSIQGNGAVVKVGRETKGRNGKGVTTVFDLPLKEDELQELASKLKQQCGTGGTVKDGVIEIQGDQRDRLIAALTKLGYKPKRAGG